MLQWCDSVIHGVFGRAQVFITKLDRGSPCTKAERPSVPEFFVWRVQRFIIRPARPMHFAVNGSAVIMRAESANKGSVLVLTARALAGIR